MAAYTRPIRYVPGTLLRPCDICGIRFRFNELVRSSDGKFRCVRWCREETQLDRDRIVAAADSSGALRTAPPPPFGVPYLFKDAYEQEGVLFNFLVNSPIVDSGWTGGRRQGAAPGLSFSSLGYAQTSQNSYSAVSAGETMRYLYGIITENKRPTQWIVQAKRKLRELADWLMSFQSGFGVNPTQTKATSVVYGVCTAFGFTYFASEHGRLGLGMLLAYKALGDVKYLTSARAYASFLTNLQQDGLLVTNFSSSDAAGTIPVNYGTWSSTLNSSVQFSKVYSPDSLVCLEFLFALYGTVGDEAQGATATLGTWAAPPSQLLSVSIAAARAFWSVGAFDNVTGGTLTGLSITTPKEFYNSYPATKPGYATGTGSWQYQDGPSATGLLVTAANFAVALRALYAYEGYSATVSAIWTWLTGFVSNPAFAATSTSRGQDAPTELSLRGAYNPKLSLSTLLQVRTSSFAQAAMNGSSTYDWQCAGLLAPIQGAQDPGSLDLAKDYVTKGTTFPVDYSQGAITTDYFMTQGLSGLSGQITATPPSAIAWRADLAATIGQMFRYGTTSYPFQI